MELRGGLERRRRLVAKAEGREIECPGPALSSALTSCPSWRKLCHNEELQATLINTLSAVRMQPRNRDFEPGFEGPSGVGALDLHVLRVPPPVSPCYGELSPCYGEIISLLPSCSSGTCTANFPQAIVIKINFPAKTGPETANSPCFLPVIRENQGGRSRHAFPSVPPETQNRKGAARPPTPARPRKGGRAGVAPAGAPERTALVAGCAQPARARSASRKSFLEIFPTAVFGSSSRISSAPIISCLPSRSLR